ncbi:MAG: hypothetical protein V3U76_14570 [Granulosicoccus sp.]
MMYFAVGRAAKWVVLAIVAVAAVVAMLTMPSRASGTATGISAFHRSGQTFLTWSEVGEADAYHIYRHTSPISNATLSEAERLTDKWGALDSETSKHRFAIATAPGNLIIADGTIPLSDASGLFVYTTQPGEEGMAYYAVTTTRRGKELLTLTAGENSQAIGVVESVDTPEPILVASINDGGGRAYTQFMDYANWNPTLQGYAFNYSVALPPDYDPTRSYPLMVRLHAYTDRYQLEPATEYGWDVIQLFPDDPGEASGSLHTWWYGFVAEHDYRTAESIPSAGRVVNFTEQRVMRAVNEVIANPDFNVDDQLIHFIGHSMGASGALSMGMRYGNVISGIYASQPMTNYRSSPRFQKNFQRLWGLPRVNLPIVNSGPYSEPIQKYGESGSDPTGVWDWVNHVRQLARRAGDDMAILTVDHGKADSTIDWQTQGRPFVRAMNSARVGFSAASIEGQIHDWMLFGAVVHPMYGLGYSDDAFPWRYPLELSYPGLSNGSDSGALTPPPFGDEHYNATIEWATPWTPFGENIVDLSARYEITIRSATDESQLVDVTPRRTQLFSVLAGTKCRFTVLGVANGRLLADGSISADVNGLVTVLAIPIQPNAGSRLSINCA